MPSRKPRRATNPEPGEIGAPEAAERLEVSQRFLHSDLDRVLWPRLEKMSKGTFRRWYVSTRVDALADTRRVLARIRGSIHADWHAAHDSLSDQWRKPGGGK